MTNEPEIHTQRRVSRRGLLIGAAVGAVGATGVGVARWSRGEPQAAAPASDPLDEFHEGDADFYAPLRLEGAAEVEHYATVEKMAAAANAVVVGRVSQVIQTREIAGEGGDRISMIGLVIQPRVIKGGVRRAVEDRLVVEFIGGSGGATTVRAMQRRLPRGDGIWFLRAKANEVAEYRAEMKRLGRTIPAATEKVLREDARYYRLVSSQGFFIQGRGRVENPLADPQDSQIDPLQQRTRRVAKLSELSGRVRRA